MRFPSLIASLLLLVAATAAKAQTWAPTGQGMAEGGVSFHNEATDTARITALLMEEAAFRDAPKVSRLAAKFIGTPYQAGTLDEAYAVGTIVNPYGTTDAGLPEVEEVLTVNLDQMDCTTFVETVLALAYTIGEGRQSWQDFVYNLRRLRYRGGNTDGYGSRLHYASDWVVDNASRGNIKEVTGNLPQAKYAVKTLDFMSRNAEKYPALGDSARLAKIKNVEAGFSNYRFPYIKGNSLKEKELPMMVRDGDVVLVTSALKNLDVAHEGIISIGPDGRPMLIHASSKDGKVQLDPLSFYDYLRRNRSDGFRVIRLLTE